MKAFAGFCVLASLLVTGQSAQDVVEDSSESLSIGLINDGAKFLAGMKGRPQSRAAELQGSGEWRYHAQAMDSQWSRYDKLTLEPMSTWSAKEVSPDFPDGGTVRYLFSGPDILHVLRIYPNAGRIILGGLEPVGVLPDLDRLEGRSTYKALAEVRKALEESLTYSFFKTADMKVDLNRAAFRGTLPVICLYLARADFHIENVDFFTLQTDGSLAPQEDADGANAVRVMAKSEGRPPIEVLYFQSNVADGEIEKSGFLKFLEAQPAGGAYFKAASYLLHNSYFSTVRNHVLEHSNVVVQDDSGIPLTHFSSSYWDLTHYGSYISPIPLFSKNYQSDLRHAYRSKGVKELPFGTGYRWRKNDSNLMRAVRKNPLGDNKATPLLVKAGPAKKKIPVKAQTVSVARKKNPDPAPAVTAKKMEKEETPPVAVAKVDGKTAVYSGGPIDVEMRLVRKSELPSGTAKNTFGIYEYEVLRLSGGIYDGKLIRVAHGLHWGGRPTGTANKQIGSNMSVRLVPLSTYPNLEKVPTVNDLGEDSGTVFVAEL